MILHWFWLLLIVLVVAPSVVLRSAWFKGKLGEFKVNVGIARRLDRNVYRLIKNVTLPVGDGTTQIDHLIISPYGIFVIETKNLKGWIFGHWNRRQWTQVIFGFKHRFQNPVFQNNLHVKAVRDLLRPKPDQVHNVVVFIGACRFKTLMPSEVVRGVSGLADFIRAKATPVFTEDQVRHFVEAILTKRLPPGFWTERSHVRNVKRRNPHSKYNTGISCPRCGGVMVERVNRSTGESFLSCRRFPRCRGARSLS